jgi:His-Xaa-Ser system protein HxsD
VEPIVRSESEITLFVDETIYSRIALLKTCYWFTNRCYIFVYRHDQDHLGVRLASKPGNGGLDQIVGEFENALLDHQLRFEIASETATLRELIVAKAFAEGNALEDLPVGDDRDPVERATSVSKCDGTQDK